MKESCKKLIEINEKIIIYVMVLPDKYEELEKENAELKQQINEQQPNTSFNLSINAVVSSSLEAKNMIKDIIEIQKEYSCNCTLNLKMFNL